MNTLFALLLSGGLLFFIAAMGKPPADDPNEVHQQPDPNTGWGSSCRRGNVEICF